VSEPQVVGRVRPVGTQPVLRTHVNDDVVARVQERLGRELAEPVGGPGNVAMMRTPDGHSRLELCRYLAPPVVADHRTAPVNALGYLRVMFAVDDIDDTLARLEKRGAQLVGEVVQYEDTYRLCYIRGPEGLLIGLAQELR